MFILLASLALTSPAPLGDLSPYDPDWATVPAMRTIALNHDASLSDIQNGAALRAAVLGLSPGDRLVVGDGVWSVNSLFQVGLVGTASAPIRIEAAEGATPVLTRPDANQNCINFGSPASGPARFVALRGFEITGGSIGVRIQDCEDLWIDGCHIHHTGAVTIRANSDDTARITVTRCDIHHASTVSDTGEGVYFGANFGVVTTHHSVVALNTVHDLQMAQGDGIELKQGSYGCVIAENVVYNTNFPGITVYGTGGRERNVITGNTVYGSNENAMQVQGEALVTNNVVWGSDKPAFVSFDHQDVALNNEIVNNTFFATGGTALRVVNWAHRPGMVIANNALYSETGNALFSSGGGLDGVTVTGNVVFGAVQDGGIGGHTIGTGLSDFVDVSWDSASRDAHPRSTSVLVGAADGTSAPARDAAGANRPPDPSAGALESGTYGRYSCDGTPSVNGQPRIFSSAYPTLTSGSIEVGLEDAQSNVLTILFFYAAPGQGGPVFPAERTVLSTDSLGGARTLLDIPADPAFAGVTFQALWVARDAAAANGRSQTQTVSWVL